MQDTVIGEILDGDQFGAVELAKQCNAGIERLVEQAAVTLAYHHDGAGAAIALRAPFLGAGRTLLQTQPIERGCARRELADAHGPAAALKLQEVSCHCLAARSA